MLRNGKAQHDTLMCFSVLVYIRDPRKLKVYTYGYLIHAELNTSPRCRVRVPSLLDKIVLPPGRLIHMCGVLTVILSLHSPCRFPFLKEVVVCSSRKLAVDASLLTSEIPRSARLHQVWHQRRRMQQTTCLVRYNHTKVCPINFACWIH